MLRLGTRARRPPALAWRPRKTPAQPWARWRTWTPSRLVNRQVIAGLLESSEFTELRWETVGDLCASAMAVLAQAEAMRRILEQARTLNRSPTRLPRAAQAEQDTAAPVAATMEQAVCGARGGRQVSGEAAGAAFAARAADRPARRGRGTRSPCAAARGRSRRSRARSPQPVPRKLSSPNGKCRRLTTTCAG